MAASATATVDVDGLTSALEEKSTPGVKVKARSASAEKHPPEPKVESAIEPVFFYTLEMIAKEAGIKLATVKVYVSQGKINPEKFGDVIDFISARRKSRPYVREEDSQKRAEKACKMGVLPLGHRDDGAFIFALPIERNGDFVEPFDDASVRLNKANYIRGVWTTTDGTVVNGWSREG